MTHFCSLISYRIASDKRRTSGQSSLMALMSAALLDEVYDKDSDIAGFSQFFSSMFGLLRRSFANFLEFLRNSVRVEVFFGK